MKIVITGDEQKRRASEIINSLPVSPRHEIIIRKAKKDRSAAQNALMWSWITIIAGELGETKDGVHCRYKRNVLVHIYERDDPAGFGAMVSAIVDIHKRGMKAEAHAMADQIVKLTSTRTATVEQFTEYLNEIERDAISKGIILPHPEDKYYEAMGL